MSDKDRGKTVSIKESIEQFLDKYALKESYNLNEVKILWESTMGKTVATRTKDMFFREQKLFVKIESGALKHQLHMQRTKIKEKLNDAAGSDYIAEIIFL